LKLPVVVLHYDYDDALIGFMFILQMLAHRASLCKCLGRLISQRLTKQKALYATAASHKPFQFQDIFETTEPLSAPYKKLTGKLIS
jgi:hypothetical protein